MVIMVGNFVFNPVGFYFNYYRFKLYSVFDWIFG
jgi:hypothetical protein